MTNEEVRRFVALIRECAPLFSETFGRSNLGPRYRVIDGDQIRAHLPEVETYGETRVRPAVEQVAGQSLRLFASSRRSMRIQIYDRKEHAFRWHFDGHRYAALLTLENTNNGQTHVIPPGISRFLGPFLYPLYPFPQLFNIMPCQKITMRVGDLLLLRGSGVLHRGVTIGRDGERILIVYTYDEAGKRPNPIRDRIARMINY